ncbi:beta-lactamase domain-containing protein 2-like isoform X2 [Haliotis cracherodii]|uniref:beta-lactamase domain-containing protein 2-like isoform X2 n=1 Tax=Haliotis cracherodii TaxID=6455 RepID=UPI0039E85497
MDFLETCVVLLMAYIVLKYLGTLVTPKLDLVIGGYCHPKFKKVEELIRKKVISGKEKGGAFAVYHRGEVLIDMWAGYADEEAKRPWTRDTMTVTFSTTKSIAAITIAKMVESGWLDYSNLVSDYWPEFGCNGKENITVEMLLSHQAGLVWLNGEKTTLRDIRDYPAEFEKLLERATPEWQPGTKRGYHTVTYGYFVDTLARKADPKHRNISTIFKEEIQDPYDIDFYIGLPKELSYRMARGHFFTIAELLISSLAVPRKFILFAKMMFSPSSMLGKSIKTMDFSNTELNDPETRSIGLSSFIGCGSARSLGKLYSYIANGGTCKGKQLFPPNLNERLTKPVTSGYDECIATENTYGLGFMFRDNPQGNLVFGHPGLGGQVVYADPTNQISLAYVTNYNSIFGFWDDARFLDLEKTFYECFREYQTS